MKIRALKSFEGIRDNERNVYPKEGDVWEVSEERAEFLKSHGVIEYVEEIPVVLGEKVGEEEHITPLANTEELEKLGEAIKEHIKPKKKKSKK